MKRFRRRARLAMLIAGGLLLAAGAGSARSAEGKPSVVKDGVLDEITLSAPGLPKDAGVIVRRFSAEGADLGTAEKGDNTKRLEAAKMIRNEGPRILAEAVIKQLSEDGGFAFARESADAPPEGALVVEGRFTMIDPGSRAKRYWGGFGAGKSGIAVEGTVKSADGKVLAEFKHRRHSGIGIGGGDYVKFLTDDTRDVGHDIAVFLQRWARGGDLGKDAD